MTDLEAIGKACFALHARMTARLLSRIYDAALRPVGLKLPQFGILGAIGYEVLHSTQFAIDLSLRLQGANYDKIDDSVSSALFAIGFNWY